MHYFSETIQRAHLQQIASFILYGTERLSIDPRSPEARLEATNDKMQKELKKLFPEYYEKALDLFINYTCEIQAIYMELGLRCGLKLMQ